MPRSPSASVGNRACPTRDALDQLITINREHFAASVSGGRSAVSGLLPWTCGALLVAGLLTVLGLRPRIAEFR
ncbi:hypothetical protein GCM10010269_34840 [Streptomyces humidus]|uniref:Uncharacterized protein n=1 Tax=Streptomyces humidus TaxID=52259 RepID=A0A918FW48_9ACTN|nr:hypothetical protein GCM10010269_34840 [Streptomyces humidus]